MKIVKPYIEHFKQVDTVSHIAKCARICYASKSIKNEQSFVDSLWKNKHRSMYRHASVYYIIPENIYVSKKAYIGASVVLVNYTYYISTNEQCAIEYWDKRYKQYRISIEEAESNPIFINYKLLRYTFCINTGIDITREYNRKSPNNIAEQSTRYVDFVKRIGIRYKECHWMKHCNIYQKLLYRFIAKCGELFYKISRSKYGLNLPPEDARWCLYLNTMSKAVYTYSIKEWELILNMREFDWTGKAHIDAKIIAQCIDAKLRELGHCINIYKKDYDETKCMV